MLRIPFAGFATGLILSLCGAFFLSACEPLAGVSGSGLVNPFTRSGVSLKIEDLTTGNTQYYGRALIRDGGILYGATLSFQLRPQGSQGAYFANFRILRMIIFSGLMSATPTVTSPQNLSVPSSFNLGLNSLVIRDPSARRANFSLSFASNLYLRDLSEAVILVSDDFRSLVGGDSTYFHFIAQKAPAMGTVSSADLDSIWSTTDFRVSSVGDLTLGVSSQLQNLGVGGLGLTAFRVSTSNGILRAGEFNLVDAASGLFALSLDLNPSANGTPRGNGGVDGAFLLSPDGQLLLGYDIRNSFGFAGGR